jgi:hypothetical protein
LRLAHNPSDPLSLHTLFMRLKNLAHPEQTYIYCHEGAQYLQEFWKTCNYGNAKMHPSRRIGRKTIGSVNILYLVVVCSILMAFSPLLLLFVLLFLQWTKTLGKKLQIPGWEKMSAACVRQFAIQRLANNPNVNSADSMFMARHAHATSQQPYIHCTVADKAVGLQSALAGCAFPEQQDRKPAAKIVESEVTIAAVQKAQKKTKKPIKAVPTSKTKALPKHPVHRRASIRIEKKNRGPRRS